MHKTACEHLLPDPSDANAASGLIACDLHRTGRYAAGGTGRSADYEPGAGVNFERASGDGDGKAQPARPVDAELRPPSRTPSDEQVDRGRSEQRFRAKARATKGKQVKDTGSVVCSAHERPRTQRCVADRGPGDNGGDSGAYRGVIGSGMGVRGVPGRCAVAKAGPVGEVAENERGGTTAVAHGWGSEAVQYGRPSSGGEAATSGGGSAGDAPGGPHLPGVCRRRLTRGLAAAPGDAELSARSAVWRAAADGRARTVPAAARAVASSSSLAALAMVVPALALALASTAQATVVHKYEPALSKAMTACAPGGAIGRVDTLAGDPGFGQVWLDE